MEEKLFLEDLLNIKDIKEHRITCKRKNKEPQEKTLQKINLQQKALKKKETNQEALIISLLLLAENSRLESTQKAIQAFLKNLLIELRWEPPLLKALKVKKKENPPKLLNDSWFQAIFEKQGKFKDGRKKVLQLKLKKNDQKLIQTLVEELQGTTNLSMDSTALKKLIAKEENQINIHPQIQLQRENKADQDLWIIEERIQPQRIYGGLASISRQMDLYKILQKEVLQEKQRQKKVLDKKFQESFKRALLLDLDDISFNFQTNFQPHTLEKEIFGPSLESLSNNEFPLKITNKMIQGEDLFFMEELLLNKKEWDPQAKD